MRATLASILAAALLATAAVAGPITSLPSDTLVARNDGPGGGHSCVWRGKKAKEKCATPRTPW